MPCPSPPPRCSILSVLSMTAIIPDMTQTSKMSVGLPIIPSIIPYTHFPFWIIAADPQ